MRKGKIDGLDLAPTRLVLGSVGLAEAGRDQVYAVLDEYFAAGGNTIDTAWIYGESGSAERLIGRWMVERGVRDEIVLVVKGACTVDCTPELVDRELAESLERLQTESADVYLLHRDNPSIPAGAFVDLLHEHVTEGRMKVFGGSNWTTERLEEANSYAEVRGLRRFSVSSPNFSLARWNEPTWEHTISAADRVSRDWYAENDVALFAWSSQAGGFFTDRLKDASPDDRAVADIARVWFNEPNFERRRRADEVGRDRGLTATQIALAYVLNQAFDVYALIGPLSAAELRSSVVGSQATLSAAELAYLDLEIDVR